jgi:hypothetical protein
MNWELRQGTVVQELSPEVARFVLQELKRLEQENVFDAPGVISGVLRQMSAADSQVIRGSVSRTEILLKSTFSRGSLQSVGA